MSEYAQISSSHQASLPAAGKSILPEQQQIQNNPGKHSAPGKIIQYKLTIGAVDDPLEHEADAMADQVMRMPEPNFIQKKCSHCEEEEAQRKPLTPFIQKKETGSNNTTSDATHSQIQSTRGGGSAMPANTKSFMESRFAADFSGVRIHSGGYASQLSKDLNAQAFTVGNDIYFNSGKFSPDSSEGKHLLAHELTHTIQQNSSVSNQKNISRSTTPKIARFTDTSHHITEEAGLTGGGFTEDQKKQIEKGNVKRDYSQLPPVLNFALLCNFDTFGGYAAEEHFDNYIWDNDTKSFHDRGELEAKGVIEGYKPTPDPIGYIKSRINTLVRLGATDTGLQSLGTAFHAIEDFFAHSNFMELTKNDYRFGHDLVSGSNDAGAGQIATGRSLNAVSVPGIPVTPLDYINDIKKNAPALSHSKIAKDYPSDPLHFEAQQLAALVVQDISRDILKILEIKNADQRQKACEQIVFTKIDRYLRPPDAQTDPWWTKLIADDKGAIDILLNKAEEATPVTVNQCVLSPLKGLEATRYSRMRTFGLGNPAISALRLALRPVLGGNLKDIGIGAIPAVTVPFTIRGHKASVTLGGMLDIPMGAADPLNPDASKYQPEDERRRGRDPNEQPHSVVGISVGGTL